MTTTFTGVSLRLWKAPPVAELESSIVNGGVASLTVTSVTGVSVDDLADVPALVPTAPPTAVLAPWYVSQWYAPLLICAGSMGSSGMLAKLLQKVMDINKDVPVFPKACAVTNFALDWAVWSAYKQAGQDRFAAATLAFIVIPLVLQFAISTDLLLGLFAMWKRRIRDDIKVAQDNNTKVAQDKGPKRSSSSLAIAHLDGNETQLKMDLSEQERGAVFVAWVLSWIDLDMLALMPWDRELLPPGQKLDKWQYIPSKKVWMFTFIRYIQSIPQLLIQLTFIIVEPESMTTLRLASLVYSFVCIFHTGFIKLWVLNEVEVNAESAQLYVVSGTVSKTGNPVEVELGASHEKF